MRIASLVSCLLLASTAAHALPDRLDALAASRAQIFASPLSSQGKIDEKALYYTPGAGGRELELAVRVNGRSYLNEKLNLAADAGGATFELLAGDRAHRDRLFKVAENWRNRVRVTVKVDGRAVREVSFQELLASSRELQRLPSRLGKVTGGERWFSPEATGTPKGNPLAGLAKDCTSNCQGGYYSCMSSSCPGQESCDYCNEVFGSCISNCTCTDPKSTSTYSYSTLTGSQWAGSGCYGSGSSGQVYDTYYRTYRIDHYTDTTYCDGHTTSSYYSTYVSGYCEQPTYWSCSNPSGYPYNVCY